MDGRSEVTRFSVPTTSGTASVIRRDAKINTSRLTAPEGFSTCPMCEGQRWIFIVTLINSRYPKMLIAELCMNMVTMEDSLLKIMERLVNYHV